MTKEELDDTHERRDESDRTAVPPPTTRIKIITDAEDSGDTAYLVLIAHPENEKLGTRYPLPPGGVLEIGRSATCDIRFPTVTSISRHHARLSFDSGVWLEDLQSTNGTRVNDARVTEPIKLSSGDRIQAGTLHFKLLHDRDVEHAYHVAVYEMMTRDGLTQLYNRRKFDEDAEKEFVRASRYARPLSVVIFDIDHFKKVNDTYGHLRGDSVLRRVAKTAEELTRMEQTLARVGGEEFAILCPEVDAEHAKVHAERLREAVAALEHGEGEEMFRVTCSFGIAQWSPEIERFADLMDAADGALYRSKEGGRNQVTIAD